MERPVPYFYQNKRINTMALDEHTIESVQFAEALVSGEFSFNSETGAFERPVSNDGVIEAVWFDREEGEYCFVLID